MTMRLPQDFLDVPLAHRALHDVADGRPENSRAAVCAAIAHGYGIEIDLQLSADGCAMVFHDYALDRLAEGSGPVRLCDAATLGRTVLRGSNEGIPDLAEVLEIVAGRVPLLVEFKDQDGAMGPDVGLLEDAAARSLRDYAGPLAVMSFNPHTVARLAEVLPEVPRGLTTSAYRAEDWPLSAAVCARLREIPDYDRVGACFISHEASDLGRARVGALKDAGAAVLCWTICSPEAEAEARRVAQNVTFEQYLAPFKG